MALSTTERARQEHENTWTVSSSGTNGKVLMEVDMAERRRGRPKKEEQVDRVMKLFRQDLLSLEHEVTLGDTVGVQRISDLLRGEIFQHGAAIKLLLDGAMLDISAELCAAQTPQSERMGAFLWSWYCEGMSVIAIAKQLGLDRSHVGKCVKAPALVLVVERVLALARLEDPVEASEGLREALVQHKEAKTRVRSRSAGSHLTLIPPPHANLDAS
jgi:hypothetical protein